MKNLFYWSGVVLVALVLGLGALAATMRAGLGDSAVRVGPWSANLSVGGVDADAVTRARVALFGLLALDKKETIYFTARTDDAGERLSGSCTYVLKGHDLAARWWSVTAYGDDSYLIPNDANIYSFSKPSVKREADGSYIVRVSAAPQEGNWVPVAAGKTFDMTARFYNPDAAAVEQPDAVQLPSITKEGCQ
tara:strand:+ start:1059 stop:1634 length:576 start_codon:yes stop_codon:yes gene_type:complete